jgi:16S rRNA (uracil1498-N3)-methyltransferase
MEIFYSRKVDGSFCTLDEEESAHCVRVLRHREGDEIHVIDGEGTFYTCSIVDASPKAVGARVLGVEKDWGAHPYRLTMAVCPTKNIDRYEWFAEKGTELGLDEIVPVIGERSERKVFRSDRLERVLLSASKQSLKGAIPKIGEMLSVKEFIEKAPKEALRLIAYCFENEEAPRISIKQALLKRFEEGGQAEAYTEDGIGRESGRENIGRESVRGKIGRTEAGRGESLPEIVILIGPEGDFSRGEAEAALSAGFIPVHLGASRLRTETAALTAVEAVYLHFMD